MFHLKKIVFSILALCVVIVGFFIWYMSRGIDVNEVYYSQIVTYEDISYKSYEDRNLLLDIIMPDKIIHDKIPVVFFVHGGDFVSGDKSDLTNGLRRYVVEDILDEGYAIVSLNYSYLNETTHFPDNIADVKDAIRYITSKADEYNFDVNNYGLWGHEAGAYLALTAAYSPSGMFTGEYTLREFSSDVNYVIDMSGYTDMYSFMDIAHLSVSELAIAQERYDILYGEGFDVYDLTDENLATIVSYDPVSYVSSDTVPTYIIHGLGDEVVDPIQASILEGKLNQYPASVSFEIKKIVGGDSNLNGLPEEQRIVIVDQIAYFIKSNYKN